MRRLIPTAIAALALTLAITSPAFGYWAFGHETIARIAMANVTPTTRARVLALLKHSALLDTPTCPAATPAQAAVWPDCIKTLGDRFRYTFAWHYQDVEICRPFTLKPACKHGNCVSAQIERDAKILKNRTGSTRGQVQALAFLLHFVGDLHQPLHAGEDHDAGGNDVAASYAGYSPPHFNLHSIWDGPLAARAINTGPSLIRRYPAGEKATLQAGTVTDWSRQSWRIAQTQVYASVMHGKPCGPEPARVTMNEKTIEKEVPIARLQIKRAGLRLAKMLDDVFS